MFLVAVISVSPDPHGQPHSDPVGAFAGQIPASADVGTSRSTPGLSGRTFAGPTEELKPCRGLMGVALDGLRHLRSSGVDLHISRPDRVALLSALTASMGHDAPLPAAWYLRLARSTTVGRGAFCCAGSKKPRQSACPLIKVPSGHFQVVMA
jgi:hypothetical protein